MEDDHDEHSELPKDLSSFMFKSDLIRLEDMMEETIEASEDLYCSTKEEEADEKREIRVFAMNYRKAMQTRKTDEEEGERVAKAKEASHNIYKKEFPRSRPKHNYQQSSTASEQGEYAQDPTPSAQRDYLQDPISSEQGECTQDPTPSEQGECTQDPTPSEQGEYTQDPTPSEQGEYIQDPTPSEQGDDSQQISMEEFDLLNEFIIGTSGLTDDSELEENDFLSCLKQRMEESVFIQKSADIIPDEKDQDLWRWNVLQHKLSTKIDPHRNTKSARSNDKDSNKLGSKGQASTSKANSKETSPKSTHSCNTGQIAQGDPSTTTTEQEASNDLEEENSEDLIQDPKAYVETLVQDIVLQESTSNPCSESVFQASRHKTNVTTRVKESYVKKILRNEFDRFKATTMEKFGFTELEYASIRAEIDPCLAARTKNGLEFKNDFGMRGGFMPTMISNDDIKKSKTLQLYDLLHADTKYDMCRNKKGLSIGPVNFTMPKDRVEDNIMPDISLLRSYYPKEMVLMVRFYDRPSEAQKEVANQARSTFARKPHKPKMNSVIGECKLSDELELINSLMKNVGIDADEHKDKRIRTNSDEEEADYLENRGTMDFEVLTSTTVEELCNLFFCETDFIAKPSDFVSYAILKIEYFIFTDLNNKVAVSKASKVVEDVKRNCPDALKSKVKLLSWNTPLKKLEVRFGYCYTFHHNSCQHLISFTESRVPGPGETEVLESYPRMIPIREFPMRLCQTHPNAVARFIVSGLNGYEKQLACKRCADSFISTEALLRKRTRKKKSNKSDEPVEAIEIKQPVLQSSAYEPHPYGVYEKRRGRGRGRPRNPDVPKRSQNNGIKDSPVREPLPEEFSDPASASKFFDIESDLRLSDSESEDDPASESEEYINSDEIYSDTDIPIPIITLSDNEDGQK